MVEKHYERYISLNTLKYPFPKKAADEKDVVLMYMSHVIRMCDTRQSLEQTGRGNWRLKSISQRHLDINANM